MPGSGEKIKTILLNNAGFKLSALALAVIIWFYFFAAREGISFRKSATNTLKVSVQVLDSPYSLQNARVFPDTTEIVVRGARQVLSDLSPDDFRVFVEIRGLRRGEYSLPVRAFTGRPVEIISKNPRSVTVFISEGWTPGRGD